jgi:hypothetical protein
MSTKTIIVLLALFSLLGFQPQRIHAEEQVILTPGEYISLYAQKYGASDVELLKVAKCESGLKPSAIHYNDGGKNYHSVGIYQYQELTFNGFSKLLGEKLDYYSYHDQIKLTAFIFAKYPNMKTHWTCWNTTK